MTPPSNWADDLLTVAKLPRLHGADPVLVNAPAGGSGPQSAPGNIQLPRIH